MSEDREDDVVVNLGDPGEGEDQEDPVIETEDQTEDTELDEEDEEEGEVEEEEDEDLFASVPRCRAEFDGQQCVLEAHSHRTRHRNEKGLVW